LLIKLLSHFLLAFYRAWAAKNIADGTLAIYINNRSQEQA
jgi:hypothetical protein